MSENLKIEISEARLTEISINNLDAPVPMVSGTIALFSPNGKRISSFTSHSEQYFNTPEFDCPALAYGLIGQLKSIIEHSVTASCSREMKLLPVSPEGKPL